MCMVLGIPWRRHLSAGRSWLVEVQSLKEPFLLMWRLLLMTACCFLLGDWLLGWLWACCLGFIGKKCRCLQHSCLHLTHCPWLLPYSSFVFLIWKTWRSVRNIFVFDKVKFIVFKEVLYIWRKLMLPENRWFCDDVFGWGWEIYDVQKRKKQPDFF